MSAKPSSTMKGYLDFHCDKCDVYLHSREADKAYIVGWNGYGTPPRETCALCDKPPVLALFAGPEPTDDELLDLACENGFDPDGSGVGGDSSRDRSACCGEYACGDDLVRFARALLASRKGTEAPPPAPSITRDQLKRWHDYMVWAMERAGIAASEVEGEMFRALQAAPDDEKEADRV
jgi:hypothetical protein